MRSLTNLLWASAALEACSVSAQALVYTSEQVTAPPKDGPPSISPITARLLLAQRLGLSQYHSLDDAEDSTLGILNTYGGGQQQIFDDGEQAAGDKKFLLIIEGAAEPKGRRGSKRLETNIEADV